MAAEIANTDQADAWDGETGHHWATHDARYTAVARRHSDRMFERAVIEAGEDVLDVGCGSGTTTCEAGERAAPGAALGLDLSTEMLALARERAAARGLDNVSFERGDAQVHPLASERYAVAISRFGSMFFADPPAAFRNISAALRPGGGIVLVTWGPLERNEWIRETRTALAGGAQLPSPPPGVAGMFGLSEPDRIRAVLEAGGFSQVRVDALDEPVHLGADAAEAAEFIGGTGFARSLLEELGADAREARLGALREVLAGHETPDGVLLGSAALLTSARRD